MAKMGKVTIEVELQMRFGGHRALLIDLDTGDWLIPTTLEPGDGARLAASVLPGWPAGLIAKAYGEWMDDDQAPPAG